MCTHVRREVISMADGQTEHLTLSLQREVNLTTKRLRLISFLYLLVSMINCLPLKANTLLYIIFVCIFKQYKNANNAYFGTSVMFNERFVQCFYFKLVP